MEYEAGKHVRESMQLVENAVLERDQVKGSGIKFFRACFSTTNSIYVLAIETIPNRSMIKKNGAEEAWNFNLFDFKLSLIQ